MPTNVPEIHVTTLREMRKGGMLYVYMATSMSSPVVAMMFLDGRCPMFQHPMFYQFFRIQSKPHSQNKKKK